MTNLNKILWESTDGEAEFDVLGNIDFGVAAAGGGWDGLDFEVGGSSGDYLIFHACRFSPGK